MNSNEDKAIATIQKILRDTKDARIKWHVANFRISQIKGLGANEEIIGHVYITNISNKHLRLYRYKTKYFVDEERTELIDYIRLEFYETFDYNTEWVFPYTNALDDLYIAIMAQTAGVNDFFDEYLID